MSAKRWLASDYLDIGKWAVLSEDNEIIAGSSFSLTREQCERIAEAHNCHSEATPVEDE